MNEKIANAKHAANAFEPKLSHKNLKSRLGASVVAGCLALSMSPVVAMAAPGDMGAQPQGDSAMMWQGGEFQQGQQWAAPSGQWQADASASQWQGGDAGATWQGGTPANWTSEAPADWSGEAPTGEAPSDWFGEATGGWTGQAPTGEAPAEWSGEAPTGEAPSGEAPTGMSGEAPIGQAPTSEAPSGEAPTGQMPTGEAPTDMSGQAPSGEALTGANGQATEAAQGNGAPQQVEQGGQPRFDAFADQIRQVLSDKFGIEMPSFGEAFSGEASSGEVPEGAQPADGIRALFGMWAPSEAPELPEGAINVQAVIDTMRDVFGHYSADELEANLDDETFVASLQEFAVDSNDERLAMFAINEVPSDRMAPDAEAAVGAQAGNAAFDSQVGEELVSQVVSVIVDAFGYTA